MIRVPVNISFRLEQYVLDWCLCFESLHLIIFVNTFKVGSPESARRQSSRVRAKLGPAVFRDITVN